MNRENRVLLLNGNFFTVLFLAFCIFIATPQVSAQDNKDAADTDGADDIILDEDSGADIELADDDLQGEIKIEDAPQQIDAYEITQEGVISYFKNLDAKISGLAGGQMTTVSPLEHESINYLTAAYLYCMRKEGTCPIILEGVLEVDLINSAAAKKEQCPNMLKFWSVWTKSEMHKRFNFNPNLGQINEIDKFRKNKLPGFVRCRDTIKKILATAPSPEQLFRSRYRTGTAERNVALKVSDYVESLKKSKVDVFKATGTR